MECSFKKIKVGTIFVHDEQKYIKVNTNFLHCNAVSLDDGLPCFFGAETIVNVWTKGIVMYRNVETDEVMTEEEMIKEIDIEFNANFYNWLDSQYKASNIFRIDETDKTAIRDRYIDKLYSIYEKI